MASEKSRSQLISSAEKMSANRRVKERQRADYSVPILSEPTNANAPIPSTG